MGVVRLIRHKHHEWMILNEEIMGETENGKRLNEK